MAHVYSIESCEWTQGPGYARDNYCESAGLSLPGMGTKFLVLLVDAESVADLTPDLLQNWIDFCAIFLGSENYDPVGLAETKHLLRTKSSRFIRADPASISSSKVLV